jgi:hypothetical protein
MQIHCLRSHSIAAIFVVIAVGCSGPRLTPAPGIGAESLPLQSDAQPSREPIAHKIESLLFSGRPNWRRWGNENLQTGDLVFTRGNHYVLMGLINFTEVATKASDSQFSHVGVVVVEDGAPVVYDASDLGVRKRPFDRYVTQYGFQQVSIRRLIPSHYHLLPTVVEYLRAHEAANTSFDHHFATGDQEVYCTELVVEAFGRGGVEVCERTKLSSLPGIDSISPTTISLATMVTGLTTDSEIYCIGNPDYGLIATPLYRELLPPTPISSPPGEPVGG